MWRDVHFVALWKHIHTCNNGDEAKPIEGAAHQSSKYVVINV